jgi:hypothetical protein
LFVLLAALPGTACDDYGSGPEDQGLLRGTWAGTAEIVGVKTVDLTLDLTDYLGVVTGSLQTADGTTGSITGTIDGTTLSFDLAVTAPCEGAFDGFAEIEAQGRRLSGGYFGGSPCTGPVNVFFVVDRP